MKNTIAIVGKPNVGKSSLFNKLVGKRDSIVHDDAGVTRDRIYRKIEWVGNKIQIIDTGGIEIENKPFQEQIKIQAEIAVEEAQVIIFVVDGKQGITPDDELVSSILRKSGKPIIVAANKLENNFQMDFSIWSLGFENIFTISAIHGEGIGDMLDKATTFLDFSNLEDNNETRLTIIGRPNVGKSSLLNAIYGKERSIVSDISGTTRDSVNAIVDINKEKFVIIDTAGINKKSRLIESVDHYALSRSMNSIVESDIVILVIDYTRELSHFDAVVGGYAFEINKPIIIVVNKWDIADKETMTMKRKELEVKSNFKYLSWAPIVFISAKTGLRLNKLKEIITHINSQRKKKIKTGILNEVLNDIQLAQPAQSFNGGRLNIKFAKQVDSDIPTFIFWVNNKKYLHFSYERFIEKQIREHFGLDGVPIKILFRDTKGRNGK